MCVCYDFTALLTSKSLFGKLRSRTLCAQWTYPHHVQPVHVPITCYQFTYLYVPFSFSHVSLTLLLWTIDLSMLTFLSYAFLLRLVDSLFLDYDSSYFLCLFVLVSLSPLYIWLGMRTRSSSSIYFATTLQVQLARSYILSLVPSSSLVKATALRPVERSSLAFLC